MLILQPPNLHWIDSVSAAADLCAHSVVDFRIGSSILIQSSGGDWTVSAAALYLIRTLSRQHTKQPPIAEHLFPSCGDGSFAIEGQDDFRIAGCNSGIDFEVVRTGDEVILTAEDGKGHRIALSDWKKAVVEFSDSVRAISESSPPKETE